MSGRFGVSVNSIRCVGCGKVIEVGSKTKRSMNGKMAEGGHVDASEWGVMHEDCFDGAMESPATALAKIRKQVKAMTVIPGKKVAKSA